MLPFKEESNKENVVANPMDMVHEESLDMQMKKDQFGPKAVLKKGVLGNYEPDYQIKSGPGKYSTCRFRYTKFFSVKLQIFSYLSILTYVLGTQKDRLI